VYVCVCVCVPTSLSVLMTLPLNTGTKSHPNPALLNFTQRKCQVTKWSATHAAVLKLHGSSTPTALVARLADVQNCNRGGTTLCRMIGWRCRWRRVARCTYERTLTPCSGVLLAELLVPRPANKFTAYYGAEVHYRACKSPPVVPTQIEMKSVHMSHPISLRCVAVLSSRLRPLKISISFLYCPSSEMICDLCPIPTGQVSNNLQHCAGMTVHSTTQLSLEARFQFTATCLLRTANNCGAFHNHKRISCIASLLQTRVCEPEAVWVWNLASHSVNTYMVRLEFPTSVGIKIVV